MLNHFTNQASGLIGLGCQPSPRLIAMVGHGDEQAELPLLWQLCLSLVNFGYSVTVLDATSPESEANPGLEDLLENSRWADENQHEAPAWNVIASAKGIQRLVTAKPSRSGALHRLGQLLPAESIVILYCNAEWMTALIGDSQTEPLIVASPTKTALLTGYIALKRLLITGELRPTIVNMLQESSLLASPQRPNASSGLSECAKKFLGYQLKTVDIVEPQVNVAPCDAIQRLALRLLESAIPLGVTQPTAALLRTPSLGTTAQFAGSH